MVISESSEMYLETILVLGKKKGNVRSIDISNEMGFSKPTISEQMKKFRENGYIEIDENGFVALTPTGRSIAERTYERHNVIAKILMDLGVDEKTACEDACRMEHYVSQKTFDCMKAYYIKDR